MQDFVLIGFLVLSGTCFVGFLLSEFYLLAVCFAISIVVNYFMFGPVPGIILSIIYLLIICCVFQKPLEKPDAKKIIGNSYADFMFEFIRTKLKYKPSSDKTTWNLAIIEQLRKRGMIYETGDYELIDKIREELINAESLPENKQWVAIKNKALKSIPTKAEEDFEVLKNSPVSELKGLKFGKRFTVIRTRYEIAGIDACRANPIVCKNIRTGKIKYFRAEEIKEALKKKRSKKAI